MPYKFETEHIKTPPIYKRSLKLTQNDKEEMAKMYKMGDWSYQTLANEFGVSKRTAYFAVNPDKQEENYQKRVERGGSMQYYDKAKNTEAVRNHRHYKQQLALDGKLNNI
jgi:transposase-like protein